MKAKLWAISVAILAILTSCGPTDNFGYPSKVTFGKGGGYKNCIGTSSICHVEINDYNGNGNGKFHEMENDTLIVTYKWLTVKFKYGDTLLKLTALPNATGKKRTLYIDGAVNNFSADIKVVQNK